MGSIPTRRRSAKLTNALRLEVCVLRLHVFLVLFPSGLVYHLFVRSRGGVGFFSVTCWRHRLRVEKRRVRDVRVMGGSL